MKDTPIEQISSVSDTSQTDDETIKEYVMRVGEDYSVERELVEYALSYVTEFYYSEGIPEDSSGFESFLQEVARNSGGSATGAQSVDSPDTPDSELDETGTEQRATGPVVEPPEQDERTGSTGFKTGIQGKEPRKLVIRFLVIVVTAPAIGWMLARAWVPGNAIYDQGRALLSQLLGLPGTEVTKLFVLFGFGLYLGLLTLFTIDIKKRVQAMLLWLGTMLAIAAIASVGWVIPRIAVTPLNVLGFVLGYLGSIAVGFDQLRSIDVSASSFRRPTLSNGTLPEFRYAAGLLFGILAVVLVTTLVQVILAGAVQVFDPVVTALFIVVTFQFVQYESETNYITLGPERSGKSMLMLGLTLTLLENDEMHPDPNDYLQTSLERASNLKPGQKTWPIPSTGHDELRAASFEVIAGSYFPRRLELTALDYAGQHLTRIADLIESGGDASTGEDGVPGQVVDWIVQTDTLLFLLDVERLVYPDEFRDGAADEGTISWGLDQYTTIAEGVDPDETIIVATKCDILIDRGRVDPPQSYDSYEAFQEAVTAHLESRPDVQELLATTDESTIHPVYFVTEWQDESYVPYLSADDNLVPVGYDHLIDEMRQRQ